MSSLVFRGPNILATLPLRELVPILLNPQFSIAQELPFEHDVSFCGLEDSHTFLLGFRMALKVSISQPLGFSPAPTPLTFDYALHKCFGHDSFGEAKRYQGEEGTKGPRLQ